MNSVLENCTLAGDLTGKFAVCVPLCMLFLDCLQTIAFYLFSFSNGVSRACQPDPVLSLRVFFFFFFFFRPCCFLSSQSWRRKRAPVTLRPQSHLRQMKQPLSSLPPLFSSIVLLPSLNDVFVLSNFSS